MSKKGLSFDQKKEVLLAAMLASGTIHNMQEVESLGKRNKIIPQAIKEVVEALLAERTISMEKVGTQNIYWAFPSQRKAGLLAQRDYLTSQLSEAKAKLEAAKARKSECMRGVQLTEKERLAIQIDTKKILASLASAKAELAKLQKNDPASITVKIKELTLSKQYCDLWTENIFIIRQRMMEKFGISGDIIDAQFSIGADFDFV